MNTFKGYNKPIKINGVIRDIDCENIRRQALERATDDIELFYYNKKIISVGKGKYVHYGVREKQILNDLLIQKGVVFYFSPLKFGIHNVVRRLKRKGHLIKTFNYTQCLQTSRKNKIPHFILVFYSGKENEAFEKLLEKIPQIKGVPHYIKKFAVPIKKNLNKLGTESAERFHPHKLVVYGKKICFCGTNFLDNTKSQNKKCCSLKCANKAKRERLKARREDERK